MKKSNKTNAKKRQGLVCRASGFTLLEIIISLALLGFISTVIYYAINGIVNAKLTVEDSRYVNQTALTLLHRLSREFQQAYSGIGLYKGANAKRYPSNINLIGESKMLPNGKRGDRVEFAALEAGQYLPDGGTHSGLVQIVYRVEKRADDTNDRDDTYVLVREEIPMITPIAKAYKKRMVFPIVDNLVSFRVRYMDKNGQTWSDSWGSRGKTKLPSLVEIKYELMSPSGTISSYYMLLPLRNIN